MSQHDYDLANQAGSLFRADLNNALGAAVTNNSGASAPSTTFAYMFWADTTNGWLKMRNSTNTAWVEICRLSTGAGGKQPVDARSSNTILAGADEGKLIRATSAYTQTLTAAATLGDGWWVDFRNDAASDCTIDPNSTETIDGASTLAVKAGASIRIVCSGSAFFTVSGAAQVLAGSMQPWPASTVPSGWLECDGSAVSRTTYASLFAVISTTFGSGDGSTTFNLPDVRGRVIAGEDDMGGSSANRLTGLSGGVNGDTLGATGGSESHTLTEAELASHYHNLVANASESPGTNMLNAESEYIATAGWTGVVNDSRYYLCAAGSSATLGRSSVEGSDTAHNNVQPTIILKYIIKT